MTIQRFDTGPRMSQVVIHGDTVYLAGVVANKAGLLRRVLPDHVCEPLSVHALLPTRQFVPAKVRCFLEALETHAHSGPAGRADH